MTTVFKISSWWGQNLKLWLLCSVAVLEDIDTPVKNFKTSSWYVTAQRRMCVVCPPLGATKGVQKHPVTQRMMTYGNLLISPLSRLTYIALTKYSAGQLLRVDKVAKFWSIKPQEITVHWKPLYSAQKSEGKHTFLHNLQSPGIIIQNELYIIPKFNGFLPLFYSCNAHYWHSWIFEQAIEPLNCKRCLCPFCKSLFHSTGTWNLNKLATNVKSFNTVHFPIKHCEEWSAAKWSRGMDLAIRGDMSYAIFSHHYLNTSRRRTTYAILIFVWANWLLSKSLESITNLMSSIMKQNFDTDAYLCIFSLALQNSSSLQNYWDQEEKDMLKHTLPYNCTFYNNSW